MPARLRTAAVAVIVTVGLVLTASGCPSSSSGSAADSVEPAPTSGADENSVVTHIVAADGGTVTVGGATLSIPAGSLDRDTEVSLAVNASNSVPAAGARGAATTTAATSTAATSPAPAATVTGPPFFKAAGPMVSGDLGGATLSRAATLVLPLSEPVADGTAAGYWDETAGQWVPLPATVDDAARTITTQVPHLSLYQPWTWDLDGVRANLESMFAALVGAGVPLRTDPPTCSPAPAGVTVAVTGGRDGDPSLAGCVEGAGAGQLRLRLVNNRPYGMAITPPDGATQETVSRGGLLAAFYQSKELSDVGGDYLPAGGEADYLMPAEGPTVEATGKWSWKTYTLDVAVGLLLTLAGKGTKPSGATATVDTSATTASTAELVKVGKCLGDKVFSDPPTSVDGAIRTSIGCLGLLEEVWLAPLALLQGLLIDIAGAYDAGQDTGVGSPGVVTVTRSPLGTAVSSVAAPADPDTEIRTVYPLDDNYQPLPGYEVDDSQMFQDCDPPSTPPQPSQFGGSAVDVCAAVAGSHLDPCWPDSTSTMVCLSGPTDTTLIRVVGNTTNGLLPDAGTTDHSGTSTVRPWQIVLQDDSSCYARTHGALGLPGISYVCGETREWGAIGAIDESTPSWTAPIIRPDAAAAWMASGQADRSSVPTIPEAVKIAYFAGAGSGNLPLPAAAGETQAADSDSCPDQATLMSGLTLHQNDEILTIDRIQCDSGFAVAAGHTANYAEVLFYKDTDSAWTEIDRSAPCANGQVPSSIEPTACHSG